MITRVIGFSAMILLSISLLDYYGLIQVTATPLKQLVDALVHLGEAVRGAMP